MSAIHCRLLYAGAATIIVGLITASCAPHYAAPQQIQETNPSVTYKYTNDQELVQANQSAAIFCNRYQSVQQTTSFSNDPDGSKVVVFDCVRSLPVAAPLPQYNPNLAYSYRTDQELLDSSRNAQIYCRNNGSQQVVSNIATNANGTRTVTYQCSGR
jgi:hypothetical protein